MHDGGSGLRPNDGLFVKLEPVGWGLTICLWLGPPWLNCWFSFTLACSGIGHECSSLFIVVIDLIFVFSLWCIDWVGGLSAGRVFVCFCVGGGVGARGGVGWLKGCFGPPDGLLCRPFWGGGPGVGLALCCFVVYSSRRFVVCLSVCRFVLVFFGPFGVTVASLGEWAGGETGLGAFRAFVLFVLVWVCRFPLPLGIWEGRRFVIVARPGLFSCLFCREISGWTVKGNWKKVIFSDETQVVVEQNKKGKRKVQGVPQSQTAALPRPQEEEETDKSKQAQTEQTYEKH